MANVARGVSAREGYERAQVNIELVPQLTLSRFVGDLAIAVSASGIPPAAELMSINAVAEPPRLLLTFEYAKRDARAEATRRREVADGHKHNGKERA